MKRVTVIAGLAALIVAVGVAGYTLGHRHVSPTPAKGAGGPRKILFWVAPMDRSYRRDKPGKSPMGMDLVPVYADQARGESADVSVAANVVDSLGVRTAEVQRGDLSHRIDTVGYVRYDEDTITSINTRAEGWVEKLGPKSVGDRVRAGQVLYELFSPVLETAEREYVTALASGDRDLIATSEQRLRSLDVGPDQIRRLQRTRQVEQRVERRAPGDAVVTALGVREGAYVMPRTQIMQLADLRTVWVIGEIDESQAALVKPGQKAETGFDAFPGETWDAVVDYVYPDLSRMTRTIKVRVRVPNPDYRLQPNMFARVRILAAPQHDVLSIPTQALIHTGMSQRVIVALGGGRFDVCPVEAGYESGDQVQILKGLAAGQRVVVSAQFMLDSEANLDAAALRLGAGKPGCTAASDPQP